MPNILVISRYFPPLSSAGSSIRLVKYIKYASKKGWSFSVFTQEISKPVVYEKKLCEFLLDEIPSSTHVIRVGNPIFGQSFLKQLAQKIFRSSSLPWGIKVLLESIKHFKQKPCDLIFVNSPPYTNVVIGFLLSYLVSRPLVIDMKDDWIGTKDFFKRNRLIQLIELHIEKKIVKRANFVITVTNSSLEGFKNRYREITLAEKFFLIPNGQDLEEFSSSNARGEKNKRFHFLSAASGYRPDYRDLSPFIDAVSLFIKKHPDAREQIEIEFSGEMPHKKYIKELSELLPESALFFSPNLNRNQLVTHLSKADLFFLVQPKGNTTAIAGNLYECWATGKAPVLLISEYGASSQLVMENKIGEHFHFSELESASKYIERVFWGFTNNQPILISRSGVQEYDRKILADQMMDIWANAIAGDGDNN